MKATAKTTQRSRTRQQAERTGITQPRGRYQPFRTRPISVLAGAGTLWAAAPLWPSPSSRITWASGLFVGAVAVVAYFVAKIVATTYGLSDSATRAKNAVLLVLLVLVPLFLDLRVIDTYNLPKFTVTLVGALAIGALWLIGAGNLRPRPPWRNGLHWPVLAVVIWTAITTATSVSPRMSILGNMGTNDGLLAAAAFAVIFFATAQTPTLEHVRAVLSVLYFGTGGLAVLYGLIQLHDRLFSGAQWDWLRIFGGASARSLAGGRVVSTFGNPNHLGGFLAILVPVGLVLFMLNASRRMRALILVIMAGMLVELLQTASRGALLAALTGIGVGAALLWPDFWRRPRVSVPVVAAVAASILVGALVLAAVPQFSAKLSSGLGSASSLSLRADIWKTGVAMANGRPLVGQGPDTWSDRVARYRDAESVERHGPGVLSNGAHNVFVGQLAATGYPGLMLLLALLGFAAMRSVGTWRRLRQVEAAGRDDQAGGAHTARLLLVGVVGALVAYLAQASFNLSQTSLSFIFWVLLGLLCGLSLDAGVPVCLRARALVARPGAPARLADKPGSKVRVRPPGEGTRDGGTDFARGALAVLAVVGLVPAISVASRPYRADHSAWAARVDSAGASERTAVERERLAQRAVTRQRKAIELNPWEPSYLVPVADGLFNRALSLSDGSPPQIAALQSARDHYERAVALRPHNVLYLERYADILLKIYEVEPTQRQARIQAIQALHNAVSADPASTGRIRDRLDLLRRG